MTPRQRMNRSFALCVIILVALIGLLVVMVVEGDMKQVPCERPCGCDEIEKDHAECLDSLKKMTEAVEWMRGRR